VSLSRIPIAFLFLISFKPDSTFLYLSVSLAIIAFLTDIADGYLARRLRVASVEGRHVDSLSDKAFYIAVIVTYHDNGLLGLIVSWALLVREIGLYVSRIIYVSKIDRLDKTRFYTKTHGYFLYAVIILGFIEMFLRVYGVTSPIGPLYMYIQFAAWISLAFGLASIAAFLKLE
jgi:cardiolipin synthase